MEWNTMSLNSFLDYLIRNQIDIPVSEDLSPFHQTYVINGKRVNNRIVIQPMEGCDSSACGTPSEWTSRRYLRFAASGAGLIWMEANAVCPEGRANPHQMMLTDANLDDFKKLVESIKETSLRENGFVPLLLLQCTHSGRYSKPEGAPRPLIAYHCETLKHQEKDAVVLDDEYLEALPEKYAHSARLAIEAGIDGVDIKACHRYLLSELLSAYQRPGKYGGCYENRTRLLKECIEAAQSEISGGIVGTRMNIYDGYVWPDGWGISQETGIEPDMTEPIMLVRELLKKGVSVADLTLGNPYNNPHVNRPFEQGPYAPPEPPLKGVERACRLIGEIKQAVPEMTIVASALSYLRQFCGNVGAAMISEGKADFVGYGRQAFSYPLFANDLLKKKTLSQKNLCITCGKCTELMRAGSFAGCVIHDPMYTRLYQEVQKGQ